MLNVVIIDSEEWVASMLSDALRDAGLSAAVCTDAESGISAVIEHQPDCIVCAIELDTGSGVQVAQDIRSRDGDIAVRPFLFLASANSDGEELVVGGGADVVATKPFLTQEIVGNVSELAKKGARLHRTFRSAHPFANNGKVYAQGKLRDTSTESLLTLLDLEKKTKLLEVVAGKTSVTVTVTAGCVVRATLHGVASSAQQAVRELLACTEGQFTLTRVPAPQDGTAAAPRLYELLQTAREEANEEAFESRPTLVKNLRLQPRPLRVPALALPPEDLAPLPEQTEPLPASSAMPPPELQMMVTQALLSVGPTSRSPSSELEGRLTEALLSLRPASLFASMAPAEVIDVEVDMSSFSPPKPEPTAGAQQDDPVSDALLVVARQYESEGCVEHAREVYQAIVARDPSHVAAAEARTRLHTM